MGTSKDVEDCSKHCVLDSPERDISQYDVIIKKDLGMLFEKYRVGQH